MKFVMRIKTIFLMLRTTLICTELEKEKLKAEQGGSPDALTGAGDRNRYHQGQFDNLPTLYGKCHPSERLFSHPHQTIFKNLPEILFM